MRYLGGKFRIAPIIYDYINSLKPVRYFEPFCGACYVGMGVEAGHRQFSDINPYLIALWKAVIIGLPLPDSVSEAEYREAKTGNAPDYLRGFIGFGCSWGGKFFGGYARDPKSNRNYAKNCKNSLLAARVYLNGAAFGVADYSYLLSVTKPGDVIYCDPPYENTTSYKGTNAIDYTQFWQTCRELSTRAIVLVSCYTFPPDFVPVLEIPTRTELGYGSHARVENLVKFRC